MTLSFVQKLLLFGVDVAIFILRTLEIITSTKSLKIYKKVIKTTVILLAFSFISFLVYSYKTQYLAKVANGYFSDSFKFFANQYQPKEFPILINSGSVPLVTSKSYIVADIKNSKILTQYNSSEKLPPASTAKLMTALIALDIYKIDEILEVPEICTMIESTKIYLPAKSRFSVKDLIYSMLIGSAGDSACVLSTGKLPYENFVSLMNRKASLIGLLDSHFSNPIGLDDDGGQNYSTVQDLFTLAKTVMRNQTILDAVKTPMYEIKSQDSLFSTKVFSTNKLLWEVPNTLGIKTGTTESAGEVFIYNYADTEKNLIIVVMGSTDRFSDTRKLLSWAFNSYSWK